LEGRDREIKDLTVVLSEYKSEWERAKAEQAGWKEEVRQAKSLCERLS